MARKARGKAPQEVEPHFRRINVTIREDQYQRINELGLSFSSLIRDLLDDRFSSHKVVLNLSEEGKRLYDVVVGGFGSQDVDLEPFFLKALDEFIGTRIDLLATIRTKLKSDH